ncbi:MAG: PP2C family protein-serine/threonine phosphatase [Candidatus Brocadiia bacterium]
MPIRSLLAQVSRANRELTERQRSLDYELKMAREVQMRLVPSGPMCIGRVCFDFLYRPSGEIGGDMFDVTPLDDGRVAMALADASGHGVGAGLVAVMVRMICRSYGLDRGDPAAMLAAINEELEQIVPPGQFATAFYAVCDWEARELAYAAAGHPMPLLLRSDGDAVERLGEAGLPLGSLKDVGYDGQSIEFAPGDKMLLFTDGLLDAQNVDGERFGYGRLGRLAERHSGRSGPEFLHAVVQGVEEFTEGREASDDMTVALVESLTEERVEQWR